MTVTLKRWKKRGAEFVWANVLGGIFALLTLGIIMFIIFYPNTISAFIKTINPDCKDIGGTCKNSCLALDEDQRRDAKCEGEQICCKPYEGITGTKQSQSNGESIFQKEGDPCGESVQGAEIYRVYDYQGNCVTKCEYCGNSANNERKKLNCAPEINSKFRCECTLADETILTAYGKFYKKYCPVIDGVDKYCCDKFDRSAPKTDITTDPIPVANTYTKEYTIQIECSDTTISGEGIGCAAKGAYFVTNKNIVTGNLKDCNAINFKTENMGRELIFDKGVANITITADDLTKISGFNYTQGDGFRGVLYGVICVKDKLGNAIIQKTPGLPLVVEGRATNCLLQGGMSTEKVCRSNFELPCYKDTGEEVTSPITAGMLCAGTQHYFDTGIETCRETQQQMPNCQ